VTEVTLIELLDGGIVHEGQADFGVVDAFPVENRSDDLSRPATIDRDNFLRTGDSDADHSAFGVPEGEAPAGRRNGVTGSGMVWANIEYRTRNIECRTIYSSPFRDSLFLVRYSKFSCLIPAG
jgi:hypothetical protein